jgi:hypothetical protein
MAGLIIPSRQMISCRFFLRRRCPGGVSFAVRRTDDAISNKEGPWTGLAECLHVQVDVGPASRYTWFWLHRCHYVCRHHSSPPPSRLGSPGSSCVAVQHQASQVRTRKQCGEVRVLPVNQH